MEDCSQKDDTRIEMTAVQLAQDRLAVVAAATGVLRRLPFTLAMLMGLAIIALLTESYGRQLSDLWYHRLGFAAQDLWSLEWYRIVTSTFATAGGQGFWRPVAMIALVVGAAEWVAGPRRTALTFWGINLIVLVVESLFVGWMAFARLHPLGGSLLAIRDVGPSAGAIGTLGLLSGRLPRLWRRLTGIGIFAVLAAMLLMPADGATSKGLELSAELAHLLAFPVGWFSAFL